MKKLILLAILSISLYSCESKDEILSDIEQLRNERTHIRGEIGADRITLHTITSEKDDMYAQLKELKLIKEGKQVQYILKLELSQSHFTLDLDQHMKDALNSIDFEMPVDREFYNSVKVGTEIVDQFRMGSFLLYGSMGDWEMKVINKTIR